MDNDDDDLRRHLDFPSEFEKGALSEGLRAFYSPSDREISLSESMGNLKNIDFEKWTGSFNGKKLSFRSGAEAWQKVSAEIERLRKKLRPPGEFQKVLSRAIRAVAERVGHGGLSAAIKEVHKGLGGPRRYPVHVFLAELQQVLNEDPVDDEGLETRFSPATLAQDTLPLWFTDGYRRIGYLELRRPDGHEPAKVGKQTKRAAGPAPKLRRYRGTFKGKIRIPRPNPDEEHTPRCNTQDEDLRRLERVWRESDSALDRERYVVALIRSRRHEVAFAVDPTNVEAAREGFRAWFAEGLDLDEALRWWFTHAVAVVPRWDEKNPRRTNEAVTEVVNAAFEALRGHYEEPPDARTGNEREAGELVGGIPAAEIPNTWPERTYRDPERAADEIVFTRLAQQAEALERAVGAPAEEWPQWLELLYDTDGLWYSPGDSEFIRYLDLDDSAGEPGLLIERGGAGFNFDDLLHSGLEDPADPILSLAALEAAQFEEARRSRWARSIIWGAAYEVQSHRGFDREGIALVISEPDIERLDREGRAIPGTRHRMRDEPEEPLTAGQREEYLIRAGAYAIRRGVNAGNVHVAWRTWRRHEDDGAWEVQSDGDVNELLVQVLRQQGVDA